MGRFTINISNSIFYVEKLPSVETGGSLTYEYEIFSSNGDNIDISITGTIANAKISQNEVVSNYSNGVYVFSNSMKIRFNIPNATEVGEFNSAIVRIENTTLTGTVYKIYNDEITNENDGGILIGLKTVTGDGVDNADPDNPVLSFPNADEVSDISTSNKFTNQSDIDKLSLIENEATKNDTDSNLRDRSTHTGEQPISSVTNLQTILDDKADSNDLIWSKNGTTGYPTGVSDIGIGLTEATEKLDVNGNIRARGSLNFRYNLNDDGITGTSAANNQIMSITRQNGPANASLGISAFGGIGLATGVTSGSPETTNFDLFVDTNGKTIVKNLKIDTSTSPSVGQVWKATDTVGNGKWSDSGLKNTVTVTSNYTALVSDRNILVDTSSGDVDVILPALSDLDSFGLSIKKIDTSNNKVYIKTINSETIDLQSERLIEVFLQSRTIISDGSNYWQV